MEKLIDLHTHSTASDGSMSPRELVMHAKLKGLSSIAVTDHDTIAGIADALDEGKRINMEVIPGVEIGVDHKPEMHILGYFTEENYKNISDILITLRKNREERNPKIIKKLNELGFEISMEEVEREAGGKVIGRPHIARVLIRKGYLRSIEEAFEKYLGNGRPAYFEKDKLSPGEGIKLIIKAGGIPVLAHPVLMKLDNEQLEILISNLKEAGLKGIEANYVENSDKDTEYLLALAGKYNLLVTGGSDFHGSFKPDIEIGIGRGNLEIPYELLNKLKNTIF